MCTDEQRDQYRGLGFATKKKIFEELLACVEAWLGSGSSGNACPGCCEYSRFDKTPVPQDISPTDLTEHRLVEATRHDCHLNPAGRIRQADHGYVSELIAFCRQVATCYLEGYGVERNIDEGLRWLVKAAQRGDSLMQPDLAAIFKIFDMPPLEGLPLRKWSMYGVLLGNIAGAHSLLAEQEPFLHQIALEARKYMPKGVDLSEIMGRVTVDLSILKGGNTKLHLACQDPEEPVALIANLLGLSSRQRIISLFSKLPRPNAINEINERGETPIHVACRDQRPRVISFLLKKGADCSIASSAGVTALHWLAVMPGSGELIMMALQQGASIHAQCSEAPHDYEYLCAGSTTTFRLAKRHGTPLQWAVAVGNAEAVAILASHGADTDDEKVGLTPLETAVYFADVAVTSALLESKPKSYVIDSKVLYELVWDVTYTKQYHGQVKIENEIRIINLLQPHFPTSNTEEVNQFFEFTVRRACRAARLPILRAIVECLTACHSKIGNNAEAVLTHPFWNRHHLIDLLTARNDPDVLEFAIEQGLGSGETPQHQLAVLGGSIECFKLLLEHKFDLTAKSRNGIFTPFAYAVLHGNIEVATFLGQNMTDEQLANEISAGAELGADNIRKGPCTLLGLILRYYSAPTSPIKGFEYLFSLPSSFRATDFITSPTTGTSAFHEILDECTLNQGHFSQFSSLTLFRFLLSQFNCSEEINAKDDHGLTPLHITAWVAKVEECHLLVGMGADVNIRNNAGFTPLEYVPIASLNLQSLPLSIFLPLPPHSSIILKRSLGPSSFPKPHSLLPSL